MIKYALNSQQMREIEKLALNSKSDAINLMARAGTEVYNVMVERFKPCKVLIICGSGNNGGDGYVVANLLLKNNWDVKILQVASPKTEQAKYYCQQFKGDIISFKDVCKNLEEAELIVDAIFGIGLSKKVPNDIAKLIKQINEKSKKCIAIDIPSGISATTGEILGDAIKAELTVTFHSKKIGHLFMPGLVNSNEVVVTDIGLPKIKEQKGYIKVNNPNIWKGNIKYPGYLDNKYSRGCLAIIVGQMIGAAIFATHAARKSGCGIVKLFIKKSSNNMYALEPGIILIEYENIHHLLELIEQHKATAILYGPGELKSDTTQENVINLLKLKKKIILDAGAILECTTLSDIIDIGQDVLLTPHEGEFKKSFGDNNKLDKVTRVKNAIDQSKCTILLKGIDTVIGDKDNNIVIQENGCPYLATAGTGDILAGMCGAFMSQGINSSMSAMIATWALSEAAWKIGYGLIAEEIPKMIPKILSVNIS